MDKGQGLSDLLTLVPSLSMTHLPPKWFGLVSFSHFLSPTLTKHVRFHPEALASEKKVIRERMKSSTRFLTLYDRYPSFQVLDPKNKVETSLSLWLSSCFKGCLMSMTFNKKSRIDDITQITPILSIGGLEGAENQALLFELGFFLSFLRKLIFCASFVFFMIRYHSYFEPNTFSSELL